MNKAVLALSLVMAAFVVGTIGAAIIQFTTAPEEANNGTLLADAPLDVLPPSGHRFRLTRNYSSGAHARNIT